MNLGFGMFLHDLHLNERFFENFQNTAKMATTTVLGVF